MCWCQWAERQWGGEGMVWCMLLIYGLVPKAICLDQRSHSNKCSSKSEPSRQSKAFSELWSSPHRTTLAQVCLKMGYTPLMDLLIVKMVINHQILGYPQCHRSRSRSHCFSPTSQGTILQRLKCPGEVWKKHSTMATTKVWGIVMDYGYTYIYTYVYTYNL